MAQRRSLLATAALVVAAVTIIMGFVLLPAPVLTFDPSALHNAAAGFYGDLLNETGIDPADLLLIFPASQPQTVNFSSAWVGVPFVADFISSDAPNLPADPPTAPPNVTGLDVFFMDLFIVAASQNSSAQPSETVRQQITSAASIMQMDLIAWQSSSVATFSAQPAVALLVAGSILMCMFWLLIAVNMIRPVVPRFLVFGTVLVATILLFASAGAATHTLHGFPASLAPLTQLPQATVHYTTDPTFLGRAFATASLAFLTGLICFALIRQHEQPESSLEAPRVQSMAPVPREQSPKPLASIDTISLPESHPPFSPTTPGGVVNRYSAVSALSAYTPTRSSHYGGHH